MAHNDGAHPFNDLPGNHEIHLGQDHGEFPASIAEAGVQGRAPALASDDDALLVPEIIIELLAMM